MEGKRNRTFASGSDKGTKKYKHTISGEAGRGKKSKQFIQPTYGRVGVLCTCDKRDQRECGREARQLLQEFFERVFNESKPFKISNENSDVFDEKRGHGMPVNR